MKNVQERDTSLEMSKEEFVKSYNLRRKDDTTKNNQKKENDKSKKKSKGDPQKEDTDGKSENTAIVKQNGAKDTEQKVNSGKIDSKSDSIQGDEIAEEKEPAEQESLNDDDNGQEGNSQDIDTAPDSAYRTDDTQKDPNFDVEKEQQKIVR